MKKRPSYIKAVISSFGKMIKGMMLTGSHLRKGFDRAAPLGIAHPDYFAKSQGPITIQYPQEKVPVPDNGRYRLFMETEDCIGCDKCARICPVDCITIETFRADGDLGRTSDGTIKRLHLPTFDIDMAKCMYCGLCTTVCPTECLVMTPVYDYSEYDRDNFLYHFGAYSPTDEVRIRIETENALATKKAAKATPSEQASTEEKPKARPMMRPIGRPAAPAITESETPASEKKRVDLSIIETPSNSPAPMEQPILELENSDSPKLEEKTDSPEIASPRPRPRPIMQPKVETENSDSPKLEEKTDSPETPTPRPRPRPIMQPKVETENSDSPKLEEKTDSPLESPSSEIVPPVVKGRPRPIMRLPTQNDGGTDV